MARVVILTEGQSCPNAAKTATGLLRYRPEDVVAILDSQCVGKTAGAVLEVGGSIPFIAELAEVKADTLLIGIAPAGGALPPSARSVIREAVRQGMTVINGLHTFLNDDTEFRELATAHGAKLEDLRRAPADQHVSQDLARKTRCHRVHTVGNDVSVGKMVTALELTRSLRQDGRRAEFIATGQTGILLSGSGVCVDHVISDFVAGAVEDQVLRHAHQDILVVEGQGSLCHPLYSGVTLGLLHGCAPQTLVMVFDPTRKVASGTDLPVPPLEEIIALYEQAASIVTPCRVVAVAVNTSELGANEAETLVHRIEEETGLPTADVIRQGPDRILKAIVARHEQLGDGGTSSH